MSNISVNAQNLNLSQQLCAVQTKSNNFKVVLAKKASIAEREGTIITSLQIEDGEIAIDAINALLRIHQYKETDGEFICSKDQFLEQFNFIVNQLNEKRSSAENSDGEVKEPIKKKPKSAVAKSAVAKESAVTKKSEAAKPKSAVAKKCSC